MRNLRLRLRQRWAVLVVGVLACSHCGPAEFESDDGSGGRGPAGLSSTFRDLFSDMRKVDLGDLVSIAAQLGTDQLNKQLRAVPYLGIKLRETALYASADRARDDLTLKDLQKLTAGLVTQYGDQDFVTQVNKLRTAYLEQSPQALWAEAQFKIDPKLAPQFNFNFGGLPFNVGFLLEKELASTVVAPFAGFAAEGKLPELQAVLQGPVDAFMAMRGFFLPRDVDDVVAMTPGESWTRHGRGAAGFNVGIGVPIYLTTVSSVGTIHQVISAGGHAVVSGTLDIQLVRDGGSRAVVDLGVTDVTDWGVRLSTETRFGIEALPHFEIELAGLKLDVSDMAQKALEDLLNRKLAPFSAGAGYQSKNMRQTIARFSFDLSQRSEALDQALTQALLGHVGLAQALANRPGSGVTQLLDLSRDARSNTAYIGAQFLSLQFFSRKTESDGSVVITTGPESQQLLFEQLDKQYGFFFTSRGYKRGSVVSLRSREGRLLDATYNFRLQLREGDHYTERDQILDHVDPLLALFIGGDHLVSELAPLTNSLEHYVENKCPLPPHPTNSSSVSEQQAEAAYRACLASLPSDSYIVMTGAAAEQKNQALLGNVPADLDSALDGGQTFATKLFGLKLAVQRSYQYPAFWTGPKSSMVVDARLTEKALDALLADPDGGRRFAQALRDTLFLLVMPRDKSDYLARTTSKVDGLQGKIDKAKALFENHAKEYRRLVELAAVAYDSNTFGATTVGNHGHLLLFEQSGQSLATVAERKAEVVIRLFDQLIKNAGGLGCPAQQAIGYALIAASRVEQMELLVNLDFKKSDEADYPDVQLHGRGAQAKLVDAGQYSLEALIAN